jgi:aminopeptidase N
MRRTPRLVAPVLALVLTGCTSPAGPTPAPTPTSPTPARPAVDYTAWSGGRSTPVADPLYPAHGNPNVDVLHYGLDLTWVPETKTFTGKAILRLRAVADLATVTLDFSSAYQVDGVTLDDATVPGSTSGDKLTVTHRVAKDDFATLVVRYHGTPATIAAPTKRGDLPHLGLTVTPDGSLWTMQEPFGAYTWYPVNDQPSDKALYDIAITVPSGWAGIANGTPGPQDGNTFHYTATDPVASYLTTLAVGRYTKETATGPHGLPLTYWYRPGVDDAAMRYVRKSPQYLTFLEQHFGPYPFPSAGLVLVDSDSGMETQQMVTMGKPRGGNDLVMDSDILHEYAHQWFGDTVSPTTWENVWLNEGWAMYAQLRYEAENDHTPPDQFDVSLRARDALVRHSDGPPGHPAANNFGASNIYLCPAQMLEEIRDQVGDAAFGSLATDWVGQHRNANADRAMFIAFVNQHTGRDFTSFINASLDSPTTPPEPQP